MGRASRGRSYRWSNTIWKRNRWVPCMFLPQLCFLGKGLPGQDALPLDLVHGLWVCLWYPWTLYMLLLLAGLPPLTLPLVLFFPLKLPCHKKDLITCIFPCSYSDLSEPKKKPVSPHISVSALGLTNTPFVCWWSVTKSRLTLRPHGLQHARLHCPSLSPGVCSNSCPLSLWCYPTISSSLASFCP